MNSSRYGDLRRLSAHTDGHCHLCLEPVDLAFYGPTGMFGDDTVTVDHLEPQYYRGGDEHHNLRLAHGTCNSRRGIRDAVDARLAIAGTARAPMSRGEKNTLAAAGGAAVALAAGYGLATSAPDGSRSFNAEAALALGFGTALLLALAL